MVLALAELALLLPGMAPGVAESATPTMVLLQIQGLIEQRDFDAATRMAEAARRQHPADGGLENLLGVIAVERRDVKAAAGYFEHAIQHRPRLAQAYLNLARVYLEFPQEFSDAEQRAQRLYVAVLKLEPGSDEARVQLAAIFERQARYREALEQVNRMSQGKADSRLATMLRCSAAAATGDARQADAAAGRLVADSDLQGADVLSMAAGLRAGRRADLIEKLLRAVQARQQLAPDELELLGLAQDANGDAKGARATLEQVYASKPQSAAVLVELARVAEDQGDGEATLGYLAHARELAPNDAAVAFAFGQACVRLQLLGEARNAMERAVALAPENAEYNLNLAKVTALSQDPLRALSYLEKYRLLCPQDPQGVLLLGVTYYRVKDFAAAEPWLRRAALQPATAAEAHLYLGSGYRQQGEAARARKELEQSATLRDDDAETHAELGLLALEAKDRKEAGRELERATALDADNYTANFGLLQLYAQTSDPRRKEQLAHFERIKEANELLNRQTMRVVELDRQAP